VEQIEPLGSKGLMWTTSIVYCNNFFTLKNISVSQLHVTTLYFWIAVELLSSNLIYLSSLFTRTDSVVIFGTGTVSSVLNFAIYISEYLNLYF
jgi:hypothetical protein